MTPSASRGKLSNFSRLLFSSGYGGGRPGEGGGSAVHGGGANAGGVADTGGVADAGGVCNGEVGLEPGLSASEQPARRTRNHIPKAANPSRQRTPAGWRSGPQRDPVCLPGAGRRWEISRSVADDEEERAFEPVPRLGQPNPATPR